MKPCSRNRKRLWWGMAACLSLACSFLTDLFNPVDPQASEAIANFKAEPAEIEASFQTLHQQIIHQPGEVAQAALAQLDAEDPAVRFAALYALANTAETRAQLNALREVLGSESLSERVLAAEALLVRGEKEAIPVLIAALNSEEELAYSLPPQVAWWYARYLLLQYTLEDFGLEGDESFATAAAAQPTWQAWWEENGDSLQWYTEEGVYR